MHNKMMHAVPTVVATSDGGVVLLMGDKLVKYDKNLTLIKETSIPSQRSCGCDGAKGEKRMMMMKTRDLGQPGKAKSAPEPVKK